MPYRERQVYCQWLRVHIKFQIFADDWLLPCETPQINIGSRIDNPVILTGIEDGKGD